MHMHMSHISDILTFRIREDWPTCEEIEDTRDEERGLL